MRLISNNALSAIANTVASVLATVALAFLLFVPLLILAASLLGIWVPCPM